MHDAFAPLIRANGARDLVVAVVIGKEHVVSTFPTRAGDSLETRLYEIGSLTKPITGEILASMVVDGTLTLEMPIGEILTDANLSSDVASITLEQLATHRSGLRRLPRSRRLMLVAMLGFDPYGWITPEIFVGFLERAKRSVPVGTYSNFGFGVLGYALGTKHGGGYAAAFRARIADRLGLVDTHLDPSGELAKRVGHGHDLSGLRMPHWKMNAMAGAGGLCMTIGDGARWLAAHVRPDESFQSILTMAIARRGVVGTDGIGLGWASRTVADAAVTWHNGGTAGFASFAAFDRERDVGVIAFAASIHTNALDRAGFNVLRECASRWGHQAASDAPTPQ